MNHYNQLRDVLNDIFELNKADLDFGIYRIINQKRKQVNEFIEKQLPEDIKKALSETQTSDKTEIENELKSLKKTLDDAGIVAEDSPKYKTLKERLQSIENTDVLEQEVFSHLANFFRRYYKDGDFISMRRYKKDVYAIPYEGEEVKLHWANHDQYYIKSSENFKNYSFNTADGKKVTFQLKEVSTEQNNNKTQGDAERRFAIFSDLPVEEINGELFINFIYEPFPKTQKQESLLNEALEILVEQVPNNFASVFTLSPTEKNGKRTLLEKHINDYVSKNSFDYFIHKDLGGFLSRELDFYIKNEVLYIDDINIKQSDFFVAQLSKVKAIKDVAGKVIEFLAQIENFQKKLWLKKKFVIRTDYCITLDKIPSIYYPEIFQNKEQLAEWKVLFDIEIKNHEQLVFENHLVLDTVFFDESFKDRLLSEFDNLFDITDGLLINADNIQALKLFEELYREKIKMIHIDPPYNTATSGFLYKNTFQHSSWISMMENRLSATIDLLSDGGIYMIHIDENEYENLFQLMNNYPLNNAGTLIWDKRNPMNGGSGLATQHEYVLCFTKGQFMIVKRNKTIATILAKSSELIKKHGSVNDIVRKEFSNWLNSNKELSGGETAYRYIDDNGNVYRGVSLRAPEPRKDPKFHEPLIHPLTNKPCSTPPNGFSRTPETLKKMMENGEILFGEDETTQPQQKKILSMDAERQFTSLIQDAKKGKFYTDQLGVEFPYCHPVSLYEELIGLDNLKYGDIILDFFAGSATTGHATIKLNREDSGKRKYVMVEMGTYFNSVTKPRIQKVIYSDNWKDGKPQDKNGISQIVKYQVLESYEDTLNNLVLQSQIDQSKLEFDSRVQEEYLLQYMLEMESRDHLFNLNMFRKPFDYQLNVTENNELKPTKVDLVETFNYLIGLYVSKVQRVKDIKVVEGVTRTGQKTLVIWRDLETTTHDDVEKLIRRFYDSQRTKEFDQIFINGDHHLENLRQEGDLFKVKMIEETFFKKMFNETEL
jgi:adenine-specific DNA-methyltransferase